MNLGEAIKVLRNTKGLKQNELAEVCGLTQAYLSKIENNQKEPTIAVLKLIASALNIPLPILFFSSLTIDDIDPGKKEIYKILEPSIKGLLNGFFK